MFGLKKEKPMPLPTGMTEFETWSARIIAKVGPLADEDSLKFALCSQIMHAAPTSANVPDSYFVNALRKAAANQVASQVFQDIKNKQKAAQEAEALAAQSQPVEATTAPAIVASDDQKS